MSVPSSRCCQSFHNLKDALFDFSISDPLTMSASNKFNLSAIVQYAVQYPVRFVTLVALVVTGSVPVVAFLFYAAGVIIGTIVAALVLDLALLIFGIFCLAVALCFSFCVSAGMAGIFSAVYLGYRATVGGVKQARTRLAPPVPPTTLTPSSSPTPDSDGETFDKHKPPLPGTPPPDLFLTSLLSFLDLLSIATGSTTTSTGSHSNDEGGGEGTVDEITGERENVLSEEEAEEERFGGDSDLWKTSLLVFGLSAAILFMSYAVCVTAYVVIRFT